jgi:hypothetical protein
VVLILAIASDLAIIDIKGHSSAEDVEE